MAKLKGSLESVRLAFGRLTQQEQFTVMAIAGAVALVILMAVGLSVSGAIGSAEYRVKVTTEQLSQVLQLQSEYRARKADHERQLRNVRGSNVRLVKLVEDVARQAGVEISQLRPEEGEPSPEGVVESRVDLRASNLSADRVQDFLLRLENAPGLVVVRRLKVTKPYRRDTVNLELTVTTFKLNKS
ncbi:MAG: hypothetical protein V3T05_03310 [Myxococcota bacterium]